MIPIKFHMVENEEFKCVLCDSYKSPTKTQGPQGFLDLCKKCATAYKKALKGEHAESATKLIESAVVSKRKFEHERFTCLTCNKAAAPQVRSGADGLTTNCNKCGTLWKKAKDERDEESKSSLDRISISNLIE